MNSLKPQIETAARAAELLEIVRARRLDHATADLAAQEAHRLLYAAAFVAMQHRPRLGLTAREIAAMAGVSREHLQNRFREAEFVVARHAGEEAGARG